MRQSVWLSASVLCARNSPEGDKDSVFVESRDAVELGLCSVELNEVGKPRVSEPLRVI